MKITSTIIVSTLLSLTANADFLNVKSKLCDQKEVIVKNGDRIFIDLNQGLIGIGFTSDQNCRVVDFKSATIIEKSDDQTKLAIVSSVGRRSSCQNGVLPYAGLEFKNAILTADTLAIENIDHQAGECSEIIFKF